jgi:hypothetical protein
MICRTGVQTLANTTLFVVCDECENKIINNVLVYIYIHTHTHIFMCDLIKCVNFNLTSCNKYSVNIIK